MMWRVVFAVVAAAGAGLVAVAWPTVPAPAPLPAATFTAGVAGSAAPAVPSHLPRVMPTGESAPVSLGGVEPSAQAERPQWTEMVRDGSVAIPALGVDALLRDVPISGDSLVPPADVSEVGWWDGSAGLVSGSGTILLAGHVDSASRGRGAFWPLHQARAGDVVYVTRGGVVSVWQVAELRVAAKDELPSDVFAGVSGQRRLVMVTCGGRLLRDAAGHGSYADNVLVVAVPVVSG